MKHAERVRWDVTAPGRGRAGKESKWKTVLSALVLIALLAVPALISERGKSQSELLADRSVDSQELRTAAATGGAETRTSREAGTSKQAADTAGTRYERYFPGRQAM